jgi:hypothetical protein
MNFGPTAEEVAKALDHVFYEIHQLTLMAGRTDPERALQNAIVESRLIHVRNLLDFFEHSSSPKDDVLCIHYDFSSSPIAIENQYRERLNKDVSHLTYSRTRRSAADKPWPHDRVVLPVLRECRSFAEYVLKTQTRFGEITKENWQTLVAVIGQMTEVPQRVARRQARFAFLPGFWGDLNSDSRVAHTWFCDVCDGSDLSP